MATRKSSIGANLVIDRRQFKAALDASRGDAVAFARSLEAIKAPQRGVLAGEGVRGAWADIGGKVTAAQAALEGLEKIKSKLSEPERVEIEFEAALAGIAAVQDGAEKLEDQIKALSELGDKPGLGFQQVLEASPGIQAAGKSPKEARDIMEQFGNAVSLSGGNKHDFAEVIEAVSKSLSLGKVDMEQVDVISARVKMFRSLTAGLDRTNAAEFFEAVVKRMQDLPRAAVTASEAIGNLEDAWKKAYLNASDGALVNNLKKRVERAVEQLNKGGMHTTAAKLAEYWGGIEQAALGGKSPKLTDLYETPPEELARRKLVKEQGRIAAETAAEAERQKKMNEGLASQEELTAISNKQLEIEEARAAADEERLARLEQELRMMTEGKEIMEKTGLAAEVVADHLQRRADNEKEIARLQNTAGQGAFAATAKEDMEIARLRSRGQDKKADKLEADRAEKQRVEQLMKDGGLSEADAKKMAAGERQIQEDTDYLQRTGRRKMRGATNGRSFTGLDDYHQSDELMGMKNEWNFDKLDAMKSDRRNRPLKSQLDREAGKPSITPDKFNGMSLKQAEEMLEVLRAIRSATESNRPTVAEKTQPRN